MPFCHSFRFQLQVTVQIHSRLGSHSVAYSRYNPDTLQTRKSLCHLFRSQLQFQIHSRHGSHSTTHTDLNFRYSPDTLQTRLPFCHSFRSQLQFQIHSRHGSHSATHTDLRFQLQSRDAPDTVAILSLIQSLSPTHSCFIPR